MSAPELPAGYVNVPPDELTRRLKGRRFALDTETTGLHWYPASREAHKHPRANTGACASYFETHEPGAYWADRALGASLACPPAGVATYVPFEATFPDGSGIEPGAQERFTDWLWDIVSDPGTIVVGHNLKFDLHMLGMDPTDERFRAQIEDTGVMAHLIDSRGVEDGGVARTLEALEQHYLGTNRKATHLDDAPKRTVRTFPTWTLDAQQAYAGDDAVITYELADRLRAELKRWKLEGVFRKEMKYLRVLWAIERRGVAIDADAVEKARDALRERQAELEEKLYAAAGKRFLWTSPVQLSAVLYDDLGIPRPTPPERRLSPIEAKRYTSTLTGSPLLMEQVKHPVAGLVLGVRESAKLGTTLESWLHLSQPETVAGSESWLRIKRTDPRAIALADRHYSRQKKGGQLGRNCRTRVWLHPSEQAVWCAVWPEPKYAFHSKGDAWECSLFRNEGAGLSSDLIRDAVRATVAEWGDPPEGGYITTVDAGKVKKKRDPGRCFIKAGWLPDGETKDGKLWFCLPRETLLAQLASPIRTLHTSLNQTGTRTSRLSSSSPNLQNTASDKRRSYVAEGSGLDGVYEGEATARNGAYRLRDPLVARPGHVFVRIDYAQQEVRMLGVLSREKHLLAKLRTRTDLHMETADIVWGIRDALHRSWAKNVTFAITYGLGLDGLAQFVGTDLDGAQRILDTFWRALPGLRPWMEEVQRECIQQGYVRLWSGRIWREADHRAAYKAINAVVQGGCAELSSVAILRCHDWLRATGMGHIVLPVHDELLFEIPAGEEGWVAPALAAIMECPDLFQVPFVTDVKVGTSYGAMTELA